ncbi:hypothetical protein V500_03129 [Pseudogymnoascus sp. VKM F-4518 (FW-2643)]|nr:hypothetical protein V500_03129 [Pseudogymnoascus sp. VKM F-4518 (FW-2643)]
MYQEFPLTIELEMVVAICRDSKIAAVAYGGSIALWDLEELLSLSSLVKLPVFSSPKCRLTLRVNGDGNGVDTSTLADSIVFSPCGSYMACTRDDDLITVWDMHTLSRLSSPKQEHVHDFQTEVLTFSPDGSLCGTRAANRLTLCKVSTGSIMADFSGELGVLYYLGKRIVGWAFSSDGVFAITVLDETLILVNTTTTSSPWPQTRINGIHEDLAFAFNQENTLLAISANGSSRDISSVRLFKTGCGSLIREWQVNSRIVSPLAFSSTGKLVAGVWISACISRIT